MFYLYVLPKLDLRHIQGLCLSVAILVETSYWHPHNYESQVLAVLNYFDKKTVAQPHGPAALQAEEDQQGRQ